MKTITTRCIRCWRRIKVRFNIDIKEVTCLEVICCREKTVKPGKKKNQGCKKMAKFEPKDGE